MKPSDAIEPEDEQRATELPKSTPSILLKSAVATAVLIGIVSGLIYYPLQGAPWATTQAGDVVSKSEADARAAAFAALGTLKMTEVPAPAVLAAVDAMGLSPAERESLLRTLSSPAAAPPAQSAQSASDPAATATARDPAAVDAVPLPQPAKARPVRLAWITLWDTDVEDGDAVRIDSQGYSRTITLTKQPVTFAIPVPTSGVVGVTGVRDGEGGGITVGIASGSERVVFPVMSINQTLNLNVQLPQ
jgi:hypothetical protein